MNKIVYYCFVTVALLVFTGCAAFRINMRTGYGPHTPPTPAPPFPATEWVDVGNWQSFLVLNHFLEAGKFTKNDFDAATTAATKNFQTKAGKEADYPLPATGCVNLATYRKAVQEGMPEYKAVRSCDACVMSAKHAMNTTTGMNDLYPIGTGDTFHDNAMHPVCTGTDVGDWQRFLKANGYLPPSFVVTNSYDSGATGVGTTNFQKAYTKQYGLTVNGMVDEKTYAFAISTTFYNLGGANLVSADGITPTVESRTSCP